MYDVISIGTAVRDAFVVLGDVAGDNLKIVSDKRFKTGKAVAFSYGSKISVPNIVFTTGGGATNAATTFGRQGFRTACFCVVGGDVGGEAIMRELRREKVKFLFKIDPHAEHKTGYSIILLAPTGERTILTYRGASEDLRPNMVPWSKLGARMLYLAPLGGAAPEIFSEIVRQARARGMAIAVNPSARTLAKGLGWFSRVMKGAAVLILNDEEAAYLTKIPFGRDREIFKKLDHTVGGIVVMTKGSRGVVVSDGRTIYRAGIFKEKKIMDRTGAGDAFGSGFVAGLMQRGLKTKNYKLKAEDIKYAIRLGSANATSVVEHIGAKEGIINKREYRLPRWSRLAIKMYD